MDKVIRKSLKIDIRYFDEVIKAADEQVKILDELTGAKGPDTARNLYRTICEEMLARIKRYESSL